MFVITGRVLTHKVHFDVIASLDSQEHIVVKNRIPACFLHAKTVARASPLQMVRTRVHVMSDLLKVITVPTEMNVIWLLVYATMALVLILLVHLNAGARMVFKVSAVHMILTNV